eukprot:TRINITY_DN1853_c1_g1_i1.p2 TRINITY_DN1853_c1_g1~~TRINITY_DN1853_c1_g1_i1.p2  ORF type:complete len:160 (-),score=43.71 TRINITY_DN1853_c1_g1_i1:174-653(-)
MNVKIIRCVSQSTTRFESIVARREIEKNFKKRNKTKLDFRDCRKWLNETTLNNLSDTNKMLCAGHLGLKKTNLDPYKKINDRKILLERIEITVKNGFQIENETCKKGYKVEKQKNSTTKMKKLVEKNKKINKNVNKKRTKKQKKKTTKKKKKNRKKKNQ